MMARNRDGTPVVFAAAVPLFAWQFGLQFLKFQHRRKVGVRAFRRTLVHNGMPRAQAAQLAQTYHEAGSIRKFLRGAVQGSS